MIYFSVCSGVEAASQAWECLGWQPVAFAEIEPFPCAVLASRFPKVPNLGDMTQIKYDPIKKELSNDSTRLVCPNGIDILVGGTPCQSFSVAGKREGLEGKSGLAYHFVRLLREIKPRYFVWENVPGALSSVTNGQRDFNFLVRQYAECGYDLEWRVLDGQYVRVEHFPRAIPQRRRRVFVVGHLTADGGYRGGILLEQDCLRGNTPPRRVKGKGFTRDLRESITGADCQVGERGGYENHQTDARVKSVDCAPCMGAEQNSRPANNNPLIIEPMDCRNANITGCAIGIDTYNQEATKEVTKTINTAAAQDTDHTGAVAIGFDPPPRECLKRQFAELETTLQNGTCPGHHNAVATAKAIGIGVDAFNSGANAKLAMSIAEEVQPTQTSNSGGGSMRKDAVTSHGASVYPTVDTRQAAGVNGKLEQNGGYVCETLVSCK